MEVINFTHQPLYPSEECQYPEKNAGTQSIGGWVGPRAGLEAENRKSLAPTRIRSPELPASITVILQTALPRFFQKV